MHCRFRPDLMELSSVSPSMVSQQVSNTTTLWKHPATVTSQLPGDTTTANHNAPSASTPTVPTTIHHLFQTIRRKPHHDNSKTRQNKLHSNDRTVKLMSQVHHDAVESSRDRHHFGPAVQSSVQVISEDMSTLTYVTLVSVFYGAALVALLISLCCRRRHQTAETIKDSQQYYEHYMKTKERIHRLSLLQRLRRIRRLWDPTDLYKMPVNII